MSMSMSMSMLLLLLSSTTNINKCSHRCFVQISLTSSKMPFRKCSVSILQFCLFYTYDEQGTPLMFNKCFLGNLSFTFLNNESFHNYLNDSPKPNICSVPHPNCYLFTSARQFFETSSLKGNKNKMPPLESLQNINCKWQNCFCLVLIYNKSSGLNHEIFSYGQMIT